MPDLLRPNPDSWHRPRALLGLGLGSWKTHGSMPSLAPKGWWMPIASWKGQKRWEASGLHRAALLPPPCPPLHQGPGQMILVVPAPLLPSAPREQARDNLQTTTGQSYRPLEVPDGRAPLPWSVHQTTSGYGQERPSMGPLSKEVSAEPRPRWRAGLGYGGAGQEGMRCGSRQHTAKTEIAGCGGAIHASTVTCFCFLSLAYPPTLMSTPTSALQSHPYCNHPLYLYFLHLFPIS